MCGLILADPRHGPDAINNAVTAMSYRGADGLRGLVSWRGWTIGHTRLAIQDLSPAGAQPVVEKDQVFAFVGEIFNHFISEQNSMGIALRRRDFHHLDGFWSVVQISKSGAYAFTDYLGSKPLYWWPEQGVVCSEIRPMFELAPPPALDQIYLANCIKWGYDYSGRTPWEGIFQLPPGVVINLESGGRQFYWDWAKVPGQPDELKPEIDNAIFNRTVSDRPVSMLLSGGLDSSIVYYTLAQAGKEIEAFSVENGESEFLPEGVQVLDLPEVSTKEAVEILQAPIDLGSMVPQLKLARAVASKGYNVCLTGDGADELFGGYRRAQEYDSQQSDVFVELPYYHFPRLDRIMMSETIELRSPFIAPRVIAAALRLPYSKRTSKQALKEAYSGVVPDPILKRDKHPLKTEAVISGGYNYRRRLVQEFIDVQANF